MSHKMNCYIKNDKGSLREKVDECLLTKKVGHMKVCEEGVMEVVWLSRNTLVKAECLKNVDLSLLPVFENLLQIGVKVKYCLEVS